MANVAKLYYKGDGIKEDKARALYWWKRAAELGSKGAQHNMGLMYITGQAGLEQDFVQAAKWYRKAAEQGSKEAQNSLGTMYFEGKGVEKDLIKAYGWFSFLQPQISNKQNSIL